MKQAIRVAIEMARIKRFNDSVAENKDAKQTTN